MDDDLIRTVGDLEARVGATPAAVNLKVIDHLDAYARQWLSASPLAFVGLSDAQQVRVTAAGGEPGFAAAVDEGRLRLPLAALDDPEQAQSGCGVGLLFLVPRLRETLRINGVVTTASDGSVVIDVQECYGHCAKALLRSEFWTPAPAPDASDPAALLRASRFMALATADAALHTDLSPKGDPAGLLVQPFDAGIRFADRPGNRRTDSFRNLLTRPSAAAMFVSPGHTQVVLVQGNATISADPLLREAFTVQGKTPTLVTSLASTVVTVRESAALARAGLWESSVPDSDIDPAAVFAAHVRLNKTPGLRAALVKGVASIPGLLRKGLEADYKRNLY